MDDLLEATQYVKLLQAEETVEAESRLENIDSLLNKITQYEEDCDTKATLDGLLEEIALVADIDQVEEDVEQVLLMTLHSAKGLEFPFVYICGMEDNVFPGSGGYLWRRSGGDGRRTAALLCGNYPCQGAADTDQCQPAHEKRRNYV